jgi:hypothetical protein
MNQQKGMRVSEMISELNERLSNLRGEMRGRERLKAQLKAAEEKLKEEMARREGLAAELAKEELDVERLEGLSLAGLFYTVLGEKHIQLKKEREEFLRAKLKHDQCVHAVAALEKEVDELRGRLDLLSDLNGQYQEVLAEKEQLLLGAADATTERMVALSEQLADLASAEKEVQEALASGQELLHGLDGVVDSLKSAKDWGTWDLIGGGIVATAVKHSRIDEARAQMHEVQALLGRFQRELADVTVEQVPAADITEFEHFADYFLDGLIMDWIVQSKIERSLGQVMEVRGRVGQIVAALKAERQELQGQAEAIGRERQELIEGA